MQNAGTDNMHEILNDLCSEKWHAIGEYMCKRISFSLSSRSQI